MYTILFGVMVISIIWLLISMFVPLEEGADRDELMWIAIITILVVGGWIILYL